VVLLLAQNPAWPPPVPYYLFPAVKKRLRDLKTGVEVVYRAGVVQRRNREVLFGEYPLVQLRAERHDGVVRAHIDLGDVEPGQERGYRLADARLRNGELLAAREYRVVFF